MKLTGAIRLAATVVWLPLATLAAAPATGPLRVNPVNPRYFTDVTPGEPVQGGAKRTFKAPFSDGGVLHLNTLAGRAEATVTETPNRLVVENDSVRLVFDGTVNFVPSELVYKPGGGQNLIVNNFCLYYQYNENGSLRSVNEGYPGGTIANGQVKVEKKDGAATIAFNGDTPHFHLTRRITIPAMGPAVKFVYELECKKPDSFGFSLPYAPLSPKLNKSATFPEFIGRNGRKTGRIMVADTQSPKLHTGPPYTWAECFFNNETREGIVFAHIQEECVGGISQRAMPRFEVGRKEKCAFVVVPFQGDYEKVFTSHLNLKQDAKPDLSNASSAIVLKKTPDWVLWADHATRKVFPDEPVPATTTQRDEVTIEAAKGEFEPFQIVIAPQKELPDVKLAFTPLTDEKGDLLAVENLKYNPIGCLRSGYDEDIPDLLLQKESVTCPPGQNAVFWVTVKVPLGTPAGTYRGTITLMSKSQKLADVKLRLKVWDFALAPTPHICAFATDYVYYYDREVDLNNEAEAKAQARKTTGAAEESDPYYTRMKFLADHRLYETRFGPRPKGDMRVQWNQKADGHYEFTGIDFTEFDQARQYCYNELHWPRFAYDPELVPYVGFINQYTFGGKDEKEYWYMRYWDPVLPKKDAKKYAPSIYDLNDDFTPEFKEKLLRYIKTIAEHCRAKGISIDENGNGPVLFLADEIPDYSSGHAVVKKTLELARLIKQADPRVVLVVNGRDVPDDPEILNLFDLWTARAPVATLAKLRKMGKRYGDYYMHGYFNLRDAALNPRVQFWSYWKYDFFWIGDWAMTMTPDLRWYGRQRNFGNNWWFPSMKTRYGEPMSTIRFELMREGLEDHEYLWMLRDRVTQLKAASKGVANPDLLTRAETLLHRAEAVGGSYTAAGDEYYFDGYLQEPLTLLALRHDIAETLERLVKVTSAKGQ